MLFLFPATTDGPSLSALLISSPSPPTGSFIPGKVPDQCFAGARPCVWLAAHGYYLLWAYHSHIADLYNSCHSQVSHSQTFRQEKDQWMCSTESKSNNIWTEKYSSYYISNCYICSPDLSCSIVKTVTRETLERDSVFLQSLPNWIYGGDWRPGWYETDTGLTED